MTPRHQTSSVISEARPASDLSGCPGSPRARPGVTPGKPSQQPGEIKDTAFPSPPLDLLFSLSSWIFHCGPFGTILRVHLAPKFSCPASYLVLDALAEPVTKREEEQGLFSVLAAQAGQAGCSVTVALRLTLCLTHARVCPKSSSDKQRPGPDTHGIRLARPLRR